MTPITLGALLLAAGASLGVLMLVSANGPRLSRERIAGTVSAPTPERGALSAVTDLVVTNVDKIMRSRGWVPFTAAELELAGVEMGAASLVVMISSATVIAFAVGFLVLGSGWIGLALAVMVPLLARFELRRRRSRRRQHFADQLHETLQMMASAMRAGHSFTRCLDIVSQDAEPPMSEELARVVNENRLGRDIVEALENVAARMDSKDFEWVAQAIGVQRETGGNLNEVLDQVAETIRERNHIRQQVYALSAEGRISAYILMALPVVFGIYFALVNPSLMGPFVHSTVGAVLLGISAVMYVLGGLWMRKIVNIEF